jgi:GT2 family glycosyltransferase
MTCNLHHSQIDKVAAEAAHDQPMTATESILITVVICTHNRAARLRDTLRSILPRLTADTELMVVDNASTDKTGAVCAELLGHDQRRVYLVEPRLGLSAARNTALVRARGEFVLFVDDDVLVESGWLQSYRAFLLAPPSSKVGVLGGGVVPFFACPRPKWIWPEYGVLECGDKLLKMAKGGLWGCNSAYRRAAAIAAGLFDEELGYRGGGSIPSEETELQARLLRAGWECWWLPGASVQHVMQPERLTPAKLTTQAFNYGRAGAIHRLKQNVSGRGWLRFSRLLAAPFQMAIHLVEAVGLLLAGRPEFGMKAFCRCGRAAGWAWQMLRR